MADGLTTTTTVATIPAGTKLATDDCGAAGHVGLVKVAYSADGDATPVPADANGLKVNVSNASLAVTGSITAAPATLVRLSATPTISAGSIYAAADALGGVMTFSNAAAVSGGSISVVAVQIADKDQERAPIDLVLFDRNPASGTFTDNSPVDPTDTETTQIIGVIPVTGADYFNFADNSIAHVDCAVHGKLNGTDLFGALVVRSAPTYTATSDIVVTVSVRQG